jgi:hypothetical protein
LQSIKHFKLPEKPILKLSSDPRELNPALHGLHAETKGGMKLAETSD